MKKAFKRSFEDYDRPGGGYTLIRIITSETSLPETPVQQRLRKRLFLKKRTDEAHCQVAYMQHA